MDHLLEFIVAISFVAILGVLILRSGRRTFAWQAAVGGAIGLVSAAAVLSAQGDLIADDLEPIAAVLAVALIAAAVGFTLLGRGRH